MELLLDLAFPHRCPSCDALAGGFPGFCDRCRTHLVPIRDPACPRCGTPSWSDGPGMICSECRTDSPPFAAASSAFLFGGPLGEALGRFKAGRVAEFPLVAAPPLAAAALRLVSLTPYLPPFDLALPVPADPTRLARRGFDPGTLIAAAAARRLGLRLCHGLLASAPRPRPQRSLSRAERRSALTGVFRSTPGGRLVLPGRHVLILDDVRTTGSTVTACSRELLDAGAASVRVATLALVE